MSATVFDGKDLLSRLATRVKRDVERLQRQHRIDVGLGILLVTGDQVSMSEASKLASFAEELGIKVQTEHVAQRNVGRKFYPTLEEYASSPFIHGIYIPFPLPTDIVPLQEIMKRLPESKDVAGLHFQNRGMATYSAREAGSIIHPPEVLAVATTLSECGVSRNQGVVIIGSVWTLSIVKILASYLFGKGMDVHVLHFENVAGGAESPLSRRLRSLTETPQVNMSVVNPSGEAVITWANQPAWLTKNRLSPNSIVIDMGYRFSRGRISGDCEYQSVAQTAKLITPVPGGVRNIIRVMVLRNLIELVKRQVGEDQEKLAGMLLRRFGQSSSGNAEGERRSHK